jgi:rare lipoprotein A (peptidoglycan hydrolase)
MIARATLAILLACPSAGGVMAFARTTHAATVSVKRAIHPTTARRQRAGYAVAHRTVRQTIVGGAAAPYDDGLAYDTPRGPDGRPLPVTASDIPLAANTPTQVGLASWYGGGRWQGHATSNGDRYDQDALTAAHATLPFGTRVRVELVGSGRSVVVVITDRPGTRRRIIDLSRGAAAALGILSRGVAEVALQPLI